MDNKSDDILLSYVSGPGCIKQLKIKWHFVGFCATIFCVPKDFFAPALSFPYSIIHLWLIYPY